MSPDDPSEPPGGVRRPWSPETWRDDPPRREPEQPEPERREPARRDPGSAPSRGRRRLARTLRSAPPPRGRRVRRTLRHIDPWSVLKLALLFNTAVFLIVCVASALLWGGARASGTLDNLESFITSFGFGNCEGDPNAAVSSSSTSSSTSLPAGSEEVDQFGNGASTTTEPEAPVGTLAERTTGSDDGDCPPGEHLVGGFEFEDIRVFEVFAFGGVVLVLASTGATVVMALLFNLMSDLTGGVQVWVVEEEPRSRRGAESGSPRSNPRD